MQATNHIPWKRSRLGWPDMQAWPRHSALLSACTLPQPMMHLLMWALRQPGAAAGGLCCRLRRKRLRHPPPPEPCSSARPHPRHPGHTCQTCLTARRFCDDDVVVDHASRHTCLLVCCILRCRAHCYISSSTKPDLAYARKRVVLLLAILAHVVRARAGGEQRWQCGARLAAGTRQINGPAAAAADAARV